MAKVLKFNMQGAYESRFEDHPQKVIKELGITYQLATPWSIADQWWFWNPENLPDPLPSFLQLDDIDPMKFMGFGLSEETAQTIKNYPDVIPNGFYWANIDGEIDIIQVDGVYYMSIGSEVAYPVAAIDEILQKIEKPINP